jgi:hypothetical protein
MPERIEIARQALLEITPKATIGSLLSDNPTGEGVATLRFEARMSGYPGWEWNVSLAEVEGEEPTVLEAELVPGNGALLAPDWVPWADRMDEWRAAQAAAAEAASEADAALEGESDADDEDDEDDDLDEDDESDDDLDEDDFDDEDDDDLGDDVYDGVDIDSLAADSDADEDSDEDADEHADAESDADSESDPAAEAAEPDDQR